MGFWDWIKRKIEEDNQRIAERRAKEEELKELRKRTYVEGKAFERGRLAGREEHQQRQRWLNTVGNQEWRQKNIWGIPTKARKKKHPLDI